ncbi:SN-glycerol-3-phosphate transport system permease [Klebsiella pneumoniae]|nr:SN-glycerol-3-phosphate transport system permease [Klebsiella pneumoniae]
MSAEISPLLVRTPAAARPLWLRLRRSSPFTLTVLMCCLALLWVSPFIWMLATSFSATTFGDDMASLLPRLPLTLDNFRDAWQSAHWLSLYANTLIFHLRHLLRATVDHHHRRVTSSPATSFAASRRCFSCSWCS